MKHQLSYAQKQIIQTAILALLLIGCVAVLMPFTGTLLFALVICVTTSPIRDKLLKWCRGRRTIAALLMSLLLVVLLIAPMAFLSGILTDGAESLFRYSKPILDEGLPVDLPEWVAKFPVVGADVNEYWHELVESRAEMNNLLRQMVAPARKAVLSMATILGQGLLQWVLVIFFAFFIFRDAEHYAAALRAGSTKLAGDLGLRMLKLADGTMTGVMVGIVGTAAAQAVVAMLGFIIAGVPGIAILTFATFFCSMIPVVGATLIWLGAAAWLYSNGQPGWAIFMILWGVLAISSVDNVIKPILISRSSSLPLLLIVVGVFGGVLVFGFIGLFLGPTLLALGQVLIREWLVNPDIDNAGPQI